MSEIGYKNLIAFHPGSYIKDILDDMQITQDEFAKRLGTTSKTLSKLINGKIPLSNEVARKLSVMFGTSADVWVNLQKTYESKVIEIEKTKQLDKEKEIVDKIDYSFFVKLGVVEKTRNKDEKIKNLCKFLKISSLEIFTRKDILANFRSNIDEPEDKNVINSNAWLQTAINIGMDIDVKDFNKSLLINSLDKIRSMTH